MPDSATQATPVSGSISSRTTRSQAIVAMFIPMASPEEKRKRTKIEVPIAWVLISASRRKRLVPSATSRTRLSFSSSHSRKRRVSARPRLRNTGARVMPTSSTSTTAPPASTIARQPRLTLAMSAPSVVASGT